MVTVSVQDLTIDLGEFHLRDVSIQVAAGSYYVLLGPTGAGKTVLIECIAGLHRPETGRVLLEGVDVTHLPPEDRSIGYVPQDYALFPHMTVAANIGFGLRVRRVSQSDIKEKVLELSRLLHIEGLLNRHPLTLSGGEKQRAALARALAISPKLLLLDEPLAAVDEGTRDRLCIELRDIQQTTGVTIIHVSHSFEETLALADQVGVMRDGAMAQSGTTQDIFRRPESRFVAEFTRSENIFTADASPIPIGSELVEASFAGGRLHLKVAAGSQAPVPGGAAICAVIRPEAVHVLPADTSPEIAAAGANCLQGRITRITDKGAVLRVEVQTESEVSWVALIPKAMQQKLPPGCCVKILVHPDDVHFTVELEVSHS